MNVNGVQDGGEPGLSGITVQLRQGATVVATATTDATGLYNFANVVPGTYTVVFQKPSGYSFTAANQGSNTALDSKVVDAKAGATAVFAVTSGQTITNVDAGMLQGVAVLPNAVQDSPLKKNFYLNK